MKRLLLALALVAMSSAPASADDTGTGLGFYRLLANAPVLSISGLYRDVALTVPETTSSLTTGGVGSGLASLAWPGPILGNAGTTILVLQPTAPSQVTLLNDPVRAEAHTGTDQTDATNTTVPGTTMTSSAKPDKVTTTSTMGSSASPLTDAGSMRGSSVVQLVGANQASAEARSTVTDLSLLDGLITIGSVTSTAKATFDGVKAAATGQTVVSGMKVAGQAVSLDGKGLHAAGTDVPVPVSAEPVDSVVKALGLHVVLTQGRSVVRGGSATFDAPALALVYTQGASTYSVTVGRASVSLEAAGAPTSPGLPGLLPRVDTPAGQPPVAALPAQAPVVTEPGALQEAAKPEVSLPEQVLRTFVKPLSFVLGDDAPGGLVALGLLVVTCLAAWMRRLPDRVLDVPAIECDERSMS